MKVLKNIAKVILVIIFVALTISYLLLTLVSKTVLKETYVLSKLEESDYYIKIYEYVNDNFENYIYQSGLEKDALDDIITKEKIKEDTIKIIGNIYEGLEQEISTQEIKDNLTTNVTKSLGRNLYSAEKKALDTLGDKICEEYKQSISHLDIEKKLNSMYKEAVKYIAIIEKALLIFIGICIILLMVLNIRRIYKFFTQIGISLTASGIFLAIVNLFIKSNVHVENISLLNDTFSNVFTNVLNEMLAKILTDGCTLLVSGIALIIVSNLIHNIKKYNGGKK